MSFKFLILVIGLIALCNNSLAAERSDSTNMVSFDADHWLGDDKIRHMTGSLISTTLSAQIFMRQFNFSRKDAVKFGAGITFGLGLVKETVDHTKPNNIFSWKDLAADLAGITLGILLLNIK